MRTRQTSGFRQVSWKRVTGSSYIEHKHGRGYLTPDDSRRVLDDLKARIVPYLATKPRSIRDLIGHLNAYETDIKKALKELGAPSQRVAGFRYPVYKLPD